MKITRLGHAAVLVEGSKTVLIDPYITDNPLAARSINEIPKVDYVLITHDHFDHLSHDAIDIAQRDGAVLIAVFEITNHQDIAEAGIKTVGVNIGGTYREDGVEFNVTPALHSSNTGIASGFVIHLDDTAIYHAGDTALFSDMQLIPKLWGRIHVALLPIGGHFTMDIRAAAHAVQLLKPDVTIPIHYNTWPPIAADPQAFTHEVDGHSRVVVLEPGQTYDH